MEKYLELIGMQRNHFIQNIDAERLQPYLKSELTESEWAEINKISSQNEKVEKLLELVPAKGPEASHALCVALDNMYPHLRTLMLLPYVGVGSGTPQRSPRSTPTHSTSSTSSAATLNTGRYSVTGSVHK